MPIGCMRQVVSLDRSNEKGLHRFVRLSILVVSAAVAGLAVLVALSVSSLRAVPGRTAMAGLAVLVTLARRSRSTGPGRSMVLAFALSARRRAALELISGLTDPGRVGATAADGSSRQNES